MSIQTVCRCAFQREQPQTERALDLLERTVEDQSTAVRSCIIECLDWSLYRGEDERSLNLFNQTMEGHPRLLQLPVTHQFSYCACRKHFSQVRPFIEGMLYDETDENTRQYGAVLSCLAAFDSEEARNLEGRAMTGDHIMRRGAAQVYARNLSNQKLRETCRDKLILLMNDADEDVRTSVGSCFQFLRYEHFAPLREFIEKYILSKSLRASSRQLVKYLKTVVADELTLALDVTERILDSGSFRNLQMNKRGVNLADEGDLTMLVLAAYTHTTDAGTKARAMNYLNGCCWLAATQRAPLYKIGTVAKQQLRGCRIFCVNGHP